jgi:hypothetical protein
MLSAQIKFRSDAMLNQTAYAHTVIVVQFLPLK